MIETFINPMLLRQHLLASQLPWACASPRKERPHPSMNGSLSSVALDLSDRLQCKYVFFALHALAPGDCLLNPFPLSDCPSLRIPCLHDLLAIKLLAPEVHWRLCYCRLQARARGSNCEDWGDHRRKFWTRLRYVRSFDSGSLGDTGEGLEGKGEEVCYC